MLLFSEQAQPVQDQKDRWLRHTQTNRWQRPASGKPPSNRHEPTNNVGKDDGETTRQYMSPVVQCLRSLNLTWRVPTGSTTITIRERVIAINDSFSVISVLQHI